MSYLRLTAAFALAVALGGPASAQETLRFSSFEPPQAFITAGILTPWAADVSAASGGAINIQMFPGGTLGRDPAQQLQLVEDGVADIAWVIPGYTPGRFQESTVAELPFLVTDSASGSYATWSLFEQGLLQGDYEKFKMIGILVSPTNFIASTQELLEPEQMKGVNFRAPGPTLLAAIEAVGAVPIGGITGPGLSEALGRKLIGGTSAQWGSIKTFRVNEVATFYNTVPMGATPMLVVMNKAKYDSLPEAARKAIDDLSGAALSERFGRAFDEDNAKIRADIEASGKAKIVDPDPALIARWQSAMAAAETTWLGQNEGGAALMEAMRRAIETYRQK